ncbi:alpha/beta fold hydrolase [Maribacter sp. CXY002]|uniref:alpha/beta fold hydrolase n=1 Tax=Maribacter luteocoastalis TaxID=3407671 RepID=UPI003B685485
MNDKKHILIFLLFSMANLVSGQSNYFKSFDGVEISYTDQGFGKPVLLLHGFINSGKSWDNTELKQQLLDEGYRVIVPDLRGNGTSGKPQDENAYKNDAEVKDLELLMGHLNTKNYYAVGYSRGSIILAKLLTKDNRIEKAVLGGMGLDFTNPDWDRRLMFMKAFAGEITEYTKEAVDYAKSINADLRSLHLQQKYQPVTSIGQLQSIGTKILVIAGDQDLDNGSPEELKKAFKKGKLVIVPGDHNSTYKSAMFSEAILKFL